MLSRPDVEEEDEDEARPLPPDPPKCIFAARGRGGLGRLHLLLDEIDVLHGEQLPAHRSKSVKECKYKVDMYRAPNIHFP